MKWKLFLLLALTYCQSTAFGQNKKVVLQINHVIDTVKLHLNKTYRDWSNNAFSVRRCDFYMSDIALINGHDSIKLGDDVFIISADKNKYYLGEFDINELSAFQFHVGVPERLNHLDPSTYPEGHALAHHFPPMHWGWAAGYRFIAIDGFADNDDDYLLEAFYEYHGLGNQHFSEINIETEGIERNDTLFIYVDMHYGNLLNGLKLREGNQVHGEDGEIVKLFKNIKENSVFTEGDAFLYDNPMSDNEISKAKSSPEFYPNILKAGQNFHLNTAQTKTTSLRIIDVSGTLVAHLNKTANNNSFYIPSETKPGMYFILIQQENKEIVYQKIMVIE